MFDIGFSELVVIGVVALVVIGPERLPRVARTAGHLMRRLQRYVSEVKADIQREIPLDELTTLQRDLQGSVQDFRNSLSDEIHSVKKEIEETSQSLQSDINAIKNLNPSGADTLADMPINDESDEKNETLRAPTSFLPNTEETDYDRSG